MTVHYDAHGVTLHHGDCLDILATLPDASVDAVVTDPPYGLEFMGKSWDSFKGTPAAHADARTRRAAELDDPSKGKFIRAGVNAYEAGVPFQQWCTLWAAECLRVLKPGGHLLAFGGTRTWHRLACAIEDAGFEIRDSIAWMYGSGFPKSHNLAGDWAGWGTALKPAHEPIVVARKPLAGTVAANVLAHGTGALNVDGCRIGTGGQLKWEQPRNMGYHGGSDAGTVAATESTLGRWPANVVLDESQAAALDAQSGERPSSGVAAFEVGGYGGTVGLNRNDRQEIGYGDTGGASRFLYVAKADADERPRVNGMAHATVKPIALMRWLVRLVTPPGGTVLEPFAGSGTTAEACLLEGFRCIAIEREADYLPLIVARITRQRDPVAHVQLVGDDHPTLFDQELA